MKVQIVGFRVVQIQDSFDPTDELGRLLCNVLEQYEYVGCHLDGDGRLQDGALAVKLLLDGLPRLLVAFLPKPVERQVAVGRSNMGGQVFYQGEVVRCKANAGVPVFKLERFYHADDVPVGAVDRGHRRVIDKAFAVPFL